MGRRDTLPTYSAAAALPSASFAAAIAAGAHPGGVTRFVRRSGGPYEFPDAFGSITAALAASKSGDAICLLDDQREEVTGSNTLFDITIFGAATRPRHDDKANFPSSFQIGTASWRNSSGVTTTALCKVQAQGWRFVNILFDAPTTAACVEIDRTNSSGEDEIDGSHASFKGCRFAGGETGIEGIGTENVFNVSIENCTFQDLTDGIKGVTAYRWDVQRNRFVTCTNCIDLPAVGCSILDNVIVDIPTKGFDLTGGSDNTVSKNVLIGDYNVINVAGTNDSWAGNIMQGETAALSTTVPSGS